MKRDASISSEAAPGQLSGESNGRLHELLIAVKDIHHALLMTENEAELFQQICNSLKQVSYVRFVWIGLAEKGTFDIKPVAFAGFEDGYLSSIKVTWDDSEGGKGPTGTAIKTGQPSVMRDTATGPKYDAWRREALKRGYASSVALPLIHEGEVIGTLNLYSERKDAFGDQEVQFLSIVAEDVALGVRSLRFQKNLRESEAKYRTLVEQSLQGILIAQGPPPRLVFANPVMAKILGYTPDELTSLSPKETEGLVHPEDRAVFFGRFSDRLQGKPAPPRYAVRGIRKDGEVRWLDFSPNRIEYQGQPAVQATFVDITERKRAEEALRRRAEELAALQATVLDITSQRELSTLLYAIVERSVQLLMARSGAMYMCDPGRKQVRLTVSYKTSRDFTGTVLKYGEGAAGIAAQTEKPLILDDYRKWQGRALVFEEESPFTAVLSVPMIWQGGIVGVIDVMDDVESRRFTQEDQELLTMFANHAAIAVQRQQTEQKLRLQSEIAENMFDGVVLTRASDGVIVYANPRFEKMFGYGSGELVGKKMATMNAPTNGKSPEDVYGEVQASLNIHGSWSGEIYNARKDGTFFWCRANISTLESSEYGRVWVETHEEITERKRAEQKLRLQSEITENMFDGVVLTRASDGMIVYTNPRFEQMFGYSSGELIGKNIAAVNAPVEGKSPEDTAREIEASLNESATWVGEVPNIRKNGIHFWCRVNTSVLESSEYGRIWVSVQEDITERRKMEEELKRYSTQLEQLIAERTRELAASKDFAENLIQTANAIVVGLDNDGSVRFFNQAAERITGYTGKEVEGRNWFEVIAPKDRYPEVWREFERLKTAGLRRNFENPILTKSGEERYVVWQNSEVRELDRVVGTVSFGIDITERKRAEEELRATRERLEYVIGSNPAMIFTGRLSADHSDYDTTYMSKTVFQMTGFQSKELIGNSRFWESRVHPDDLPRYHAELPQFRKEGHHVFEYRFLHKDGTYRWLREEAILIHDASGKPVEVIGYGTDITERRRMEEELRAARERLEFMITSNPAVIYAGKPLADYSDFVLTYVSDRVAAMLGFEGREFIGHPEFWKRRVHPEDVRSVLAEMPRLWKEGQYSFDYRFLHKDGTYRWIREEAKVVRDADGKPIEINGYWTDITERKHLEEALAKSQRLAAIGETSAMVGHDLRNPLQGIAGIVYLAKRNLESRKATDRKAVTELLDTVQEQITYMDKIVSDLQDYAQPLAPKLTETNLPNLIRQTLSTIKIPGAVKVSVEIEKAAENAMIDPALMRRTLTNLATNAIQAMPKRGKLTIRARGKRDSTIMTVEDTGAGIPRKNLAKLFSPFFTTKAKGQGLGLAVCKRLVEAQGGTITVKSKPRKGTIFTIKVPRGKREVAS